ncbi:hypothetical protein DFH08DRAFT_825553 [Mycena albidolilacea]|uniref:Uncharacterized protein n=1 Tax=Mycena albidolilacea TaxID=1033008 RepID=A0AAD6Z1M6_9AGAR|nr:hypothetical protein DFH08DRAFT_825553 [Mycena albidolilacea]
MSQSPGTIDEYESSLLDVTGHRAHELNQIVQYTIKNNSKKFAAMEKQGTGNKGNTMDQINRSLFTETVMVFMSKQEVSHQQVMSYLVGRGDYYTSDTFKPLKWGEVDQYIAAQEVATVTGLGPLNVVPGCTTMDVDRPVLLSVGTSMRTDNEPHVDTGEPVLEGDEDEFVVNESEPKVLLVISDNWASVPSVVFEYPHRSHDDVQKSEPVGA